MSLGKAPLQRKHLLRKRLVHELHSRAASCGKAPLQRQHLERYLLEHELHSRATSRGNAPPQEQHFDWRAAAWVWPWLLPGLPSCCAVLRRSGDSLSATESRPIIPVAISSAASVTAAIRKFFIGVITFRWLFQRAHRSPANDALERTHRPILQSRSHHRGRYRCQRRLRHPKAELARREHSHCFHSCEPPGAMTYRIQSLCT